MAEEYGEDYYFYGHRDDNDDPRADDPEVYQYCSSCNYVLQWVDDDDLCTGCKEYKE